MRKFRTMQPVRATLTYEKLPKKTLRHVTLHDKHETRITYGSYLGFIKKRELLTYGSYSDALKGPPMR